MAKQVHLHNLFEAHTKDISEILIEPEEIIACPICFEKFPKEAIDLKLVNDGHVWPKDIRKLSENAAHMQVIVCKACNELASRADKQMQVFENVKKGDESGELYGTRLVQLHEADNDKPIQLRVNVQIIDGKTYKITGRLGDNLSFRDSSPEDKERFDAIFKKQKKVKMTIHPPENYNPEIVPAAWITSAYLMAFYALGYRYIMQPGMQMVRDYILDSFEKKPEEIVVPREDNFSLQNYVGEYFPDPRIAFVYPLEPGQRSFLQISFFSYEVRLPVMFQPSAMEFILSGLWNRLGSEFQGVLDEGDPLLFTIPCTKTVIHDCLFDYLLGKGFKPKMKEPEQAA